MRFKPYYAYRERCWYRFHSKEHYAAYAVYCAALINDVEVTEEVADPINVTEAKYRFKYQWRAQ